MWYINGWTIKKGAPKCRTRFRHHLTYWIMRVGSMARQEQWLTALDLRVHSNGSLIAQNDIGQSAFNSQCLCSIRQIRHLILDMKSIIQPSATTINHKESNTWNSWDAMRLTSINYDYLIWLANERLYVYIYIYETIIVNANLTIIIYYHQMIIIN